ncbi:MAG: site-specific recombinase [Moraxella sp.]|nr:site-specific recombinase [Moraxella sp.]
MMTETYQSLEHILQYITKLKDLPEPASLKRLVDALRVEKIDETIINDKIDELLELLREYPEYAAGLACFLLTLTNNYRQIMLYTDTGILSDHNFMQSVNRLIGHRFLPLLPEQDSAVELAAYLFNHKDDGRWLAAIEKDKWQALVSLLKVDDEHLHLVATAKNSILNAIVVLSYRISGMGLHPDLMAVYPQILNYSAPFVAQNQEAVLFVNQYRKVHELDALTDIRPAEEVNPAPLLVMLEQCEDILASVRKRIYRTGISIRLTNMLVRLEQSLVRMHTLIELVLDSVDTRDKAIARLVHTIVRTANNRYSFGYLIENNTKLLSRKVTENASRVGEHYISTDKAGYKKMYKKAAIGGLFIGCMATLKTLAYELTLAPIGRAFVNSMIYGLGFVTIHIAGGTVATKQPAMTAAAIASTISSSTGSKAQQFTKLADLVVDILRTQFVAILGNMSIAMPVALLIAFGWQYYYGTPMIDGKMAAHMLHDLDPFHSLSIPHAAIAGVFLFLSGLISGYYDNLAAYNNIGERLRRHWLLIKVMPKKLLTRVSTFIENNLGAIMGNFIFGCFLGSTATVGYMLGLPLDIRHIAFASANFVHGIFFLSPMDLTPMVIGVSFLGVLLIGMTNLAVSFSLALMVALRSKDVEPFEWHRLGKLVFGHLITRPLDFVWPRSETVKYARIDSEGQMIDIDQPEKEKVLSDAYVVRRLGKAQKKKSETDNSKSAAEEMVHKTVHKDGESDVSTIQPLPKPDKPPQLPK